MPDDLARDLSSLAEDSAASTSGRPMPAALGFRQPAEWERHRATWLGWPHHAEDWPGKLAAIRWVYVDIIRQLTRSEKVGLLVRGERSEAKAREALTKGGISL